MSNSVLGLIKANPSSTDFTVELDIASKLRIKLFAVES